MLNSARILPSNQFLSPTPRKTPELKNAVRFSFVFVFLMFNAFTAT
jgi:hypothetical protein